MVDPGYGQHDMLTEQAGPDIARLMRRLLRGIPVVLVFCVLTTALSFVVLEKLPPSYKSTASILIDPKTQGNASVDTSFGSAFVDNSKISSIELILHSSNLLRQVVRQLHLADDAYYGGDTPSVFRNLLSLVSASPAPETHLTQKDQEDRAVSKLWRSVNPQRIGTTYVIDLTVTAPKAADAARIASAIAEDYIASLTESRVADARQAEAELTSRLTSQRNALVASENNVAMLQQKYGVVGSDQKDDTAVDRQSVGGVNQELIGAQGDVATAQSRYEAAMALKRAGGNLQSLPDVAGSPVIQDLQKQRAAASQRLATLSTRYSGDYPSVKQTHNELQAVDEMIAQQTQRILEGLKSQYVAAQAHQGALNAEMNRLVGKVTATTKAESRVELREAQRVAEANRVTYEASLAKLRDIQQQESGSDVEARVISAPDVSSTPSFPRPIQILPAGAMLGILLGLGFVLVVPIGSEKVESAEDAEKDVALGVIGILPYLSASALTHEGKTLSIVDYLRLLPFSSYGEALRLLRYRLQAGPSKGSLVVQVTSAVPGEGKSTIAASLAVSAATSKIRTILVDLDLHRPTAGKLLGLDKNAGMIEVLSGTAAADDARQAHEDLSLQVIGAGSNKSLQPGMVESPQLAEMIRSLKNQFDLIIIDSPPVLALSDAIALSRLADAVMIVVSWRETPRDLLRKALEQLRAANAPLAGFVLNKVKAAKALTYSGDYYGYANVQAVFHPPRLKQLEDEEDEIPPPDDRETASLEDEEKELSLLELAFSTLESGGKESEIRTPDDQEAASLKDQEKELSSTELASSTPEPGGREGEILTPGDQEVASLKDEEKVLSAPELVTSTGEPHGKEGKLLPPDDQVSGRDGVWRLKIGARGYRRARRRKA